MPRKKTRKLKPEQIPAIVHELLESYFWLPTLAANTRYTRLHDDHDGDRDGWLSVTIGEDGDAWVDPLNPDAGGLRFRMPMTGGGMSQRTRTALVILAEAIRLDNEEKPQRPPSPDDMNPEAMANIKAMAEIANRLGFVSPTNPNDAVRWVCPSCNTVNPIDEPKCLGCSKCKPLEKKAT